MASIWPIPSDPWTFLDGRIGAPAGAAQIPALLNGYAVRPPWRASGVDYWVGPRPSVTLRDPFQGLMPSNANLHAELVALGADANIHGNADLIQFSGGSAINGVISGWDFSGALNNGGANGGSGVLINASGMMVTDCNFVIEPVRRIVPIAMGNGASVNGFTLQYFTIDARLPPSTTENSTLSAVTVAADGIVTIQYGWFKGTYLQHIQWGADHTTFAQTKGVVRFNLFEDAGYGAAVALFTGSVSGTTLTTSSHSGAPLFTNMALYDQAGTITNVYVVSQLSGVTNGAGTYQLNTNLGTVTARNMSTGWGGYNTGGHGDHVQVAGSSGTPVIGAFEASFNTHCQRQAANRTSTRGYAFMSNGVNTLTMNALKCNNNTWIVPSGSNVNYDFTIDVTDLGSNAAAQILQNYIDQTGNLQVGGNWITPNETANGPWAGTLNKIGNISLITGAGLP